MRRKIRFNQGIIGGEDKDKVVFILPELEKHFRQRKTYYEYYFDDGTEVVLSLEDISDLSGEFTIKIDYDTLTIVVQ